MSMHKRTAIVKNLAFLCSFFILPLFPFVSIAQAPAPLAPQQSAPKPSSTVRFQHLGSEQGLPQNSVRSILQDRFGYLWFGTEDGLARYDGHGFTVYRHNPGDSTTLSNSYAIVLLETHSTAAAGGTLWVGTNGGGLNRFDRASGKFKCFRHNPADPTSLSENNVRAIFEDRSGVLWVGTFGTSGGGLNRFDPTTEKFVRYNNNTNDPTSLSSNVVRAILEDKFGNLWVATDSGLDRLNRATGTFDHYRHNPTDSTSLSNNVILSLLEDPGYGNQGGGLWVGTRDGGLDRFDPATGIFKHYRHHTTDTTSLSDNMVWDLLEDHEGKIWVGTVNGLNRFDRITGKFTRFEHNPANGTSLSNSYILSLLEDRTGTLWVGTGNGGLNYFNRATEAFIHYKRRADNPVSLSDNVVRSLLEDHTGTLWIGTNGGLNTLNRATGNFKVYRNNPSDAASLSDNIVWSLLEDRAHTVWAGTQAGGLNRFDRASGKFTHYKHNPKDSTSLSNNDVRVLLEDRSGALWAGSLWGGLNCFNRTTGTFTRYQNHPNDPTSLSGNNIRSLLEDRTGTLWVGTGTYGLNRFDRATGKFVRYLHNPNDAASLSHNSVRSLLEDHEGTLWVGTHGGLNRLDRATGKFTVFNEKDGLPNDVVYGIMEDERGNLWISTNNGLCRFNPRSRTFTKLDKRDGLQDNEFNGGAFCRGIRGQMYFGGINGLNEFVPDSVRTDTVPPQILITMFKKFNRPVVLDSAIEEKKVITLLHNEQDISFEFASMSFRVIERNLYSHKLEGYDADWSPPGTEHKATYTNLDPGEYVFRVRGSNCDGVWNMVGAQVHVIILPPWWRSWWAYTAYVLCGIGVFSMLNILVQRRRIQILRDRQKQREEEILRLSNIQLTAANDEITRQQELVVLQNKHLQELDTEKNEMLGIVAHDLKSPLSGIRNLAALMEEYAETLSKGDIARYSQMIHESSNRMFQIVRSLLDVNALEQGGIKPFFVETDCAELLLPLIEEYRERAAAKSLRLDYEAPPAFFVCTDTGLLIQVVENLLSNAVKYSPPHTSIRLHIESLQPTPALEHGENGENGQEGNSVERSDWLQGLRISVRDEGPGFQDAEKHKLFGKFARLSAQPTGGEHSTGLGLSIVKKMVEAMNGNVWCESEAGKGATFIVELPLVAEEARNSSIFITEEISE